MSTTAGNVISDLDVLGLFVHPVLELGGISLDKMTFGNSGLPKEHLLFSILCDGKSIATEVLATAPLIVSRGQNGELLLTPQQERKGFGPLAITKSTNSKGPDAARPQEITEWLSELYGRRCTLQAMKTSPPVPIALVSYASLLTVSEALTTPLTAEMLGVNLVVQTESAFAEASWNGHIVIDKVPFRLGDAISFQNIQAEALPWKHELRPEQQDLRTYLAGAGGAFVFGRFLTATAEGVITRF